MAKFDWNETKRQITDSQAWQSIFRHGYEDTPRNRILMVSGNVWLHLHPSKVQKHTVRLRFTWCMGGITFLLFLVTVITGVYLMLYYRPTAEYAYADMKYLEFDMPFGMLMRNMHRWAAHGMVIAVWLHMLPRLHDGIVQTAARVQLGGRRDPAGVDAAAVVHRIPVAMGSTFDLGGDGRIEHGARHAAAGAWRSVP